MLGPTFGASHRVCEPIFVGVGSLLPPSIRQVYDHDLRGHVYGSGRMWDVLVMVNEVRFRRKGVRFAILGSVAFCKNI